jgi:hypothetical protein
VAIGGAIKSVWVLIRPFVIYAGALNMPDRAPPSVPTVMFNGNIVGALLFGGRDVDCLQMELTRACDPAAVVYRGPGFIRTDGDGQLSFKVYPTEPTHSGAADEWLRTSIPGQLIDRRDFYSLTATDFAGNVWTSEGILPYRTQGPAGFSVHANLRDLRSTKEIEVTFEGSSQRMLFLDDIEIPCNAITNTTLQRAAGVTDEASALNLAEFSSCGADFLLRPEAGRLLVELSSVDPFPQNFQLRVIESLQFVLAKSLHCRFYEEIVGNTSTIRLTSARPKSIETRMPPPLHLHTAEAHHKSNQIWQMFDRYLQYIIPYQGQDWYPCSIHVHKAREASANSFDARALGLTIAIEGVVRELYPDLGRPSTEFRKAVRQLKSFCARWTGMAGWDDNDSLLQRADNQLSQLCSVRAIDRLFCLADRGSVQRTHVDAWKALRNPTAHAELPNPADNQLFVDRVMAATVLLYHLVFSQIGYAGPFSDYSTRGFPVVLYSPPQNAENGAARQ